METTSKILRLFVLLMTICLLPSLISCALRVRGQAGNEAQSVPETASDAEPLDLLPQAGLLFGSAPRFTSSGKGIVFTLGAASAAQGAASAEIVVTSSVYSLKKGIVECATSGCYDVVPCAHPSSLFAGGTEFVRIAQDPARLSEASVLLGADGNDPSSYVLSEVPLNFSGMMPGDVGGITATLYLYDESGKAMARTVLDTLCWCVGDGGVAFAPGATFCAVADAVMIKCGTLSPDGAVFDYTGSGLMACIPPVLNPDGEPRPS